MKRGAFKQGIEQPDQKVKIHTPVLSRQTLVDRSGLTPLKRCSVNYRQGGVRGANELPKRRSWYFDDEKFTNNRLSVFTTTVKAGAGMRPMVLDWGDVED